MAFAQNETVLGQEFIREAVRLKPSIIEGMPCELMTSFLINCIDDENLNHETQLQSVLDQLPPELDWLFDQYSWAVMQGYLLKGTRALIWDRPDNGRDYFERAVMLNAQVDDYFLGILTDKLLDYEAEFGIEAAEDIHQSLGPYLKKVDKKNSIPRLQSSLMINRAFQSYHAGDYARVPMTILPAIVRNPKYLANRGVLSILFHSVLYSWTRLRSTSH
ncbi:MAG TPA: hypothetical protein DCX53_05565 [Anaerolineae bacterium]|nr:hypothetical protein [Anaerolineae bacterium]